MTRKLPEDDVLRQLLDEGADSLGVPVPSTLKLSSVVMERWLTSLILPLFGSCLFLAGLITLTNFSAFRSLVALIGAAAALAVAWQLLRTRSVSLRSRAHFAGASAAAAMIASFALANDTAAVALAAGCALVFVSLIAWERVHSNAALLFALCFAIVSARRGDLPAAILELLTLVALFAALERARAQSAKVVSLLLIGLAALATDAGHPAWFNKSCALAALVATITHRQRADAARNSPQALFVGDFPIAVALALLLSESFDSASLELRVWLWAGGIVLFELVAMARTRALDPSRLATVAAALVIAVWCSSQSIPWHVPILATLTVAALSNELAHRRGWALLQAVGSAGVLAASAALGIIGRSHEATPVAISIGAFATAGVVMASLPGAFEPALPWWTGLIRRRNLTLIRGYGRRAIAPLLKIRSLTLLAAWVVLPLSWIRHFRERFFPPAVRYWQYSLGHAFGAWILADQGSRLLAWHYLRSEEQMVQPMLFAVIVSTYGIALAWSGLKRQHGYARLIGIACAAAPAAQAIAARRAIDGRVLAVILIATGTGLAMIGLLIRSARGSRVNAGPHDIGLAD